MAVLILSSLVAADRFFLYLEEPNFVLSFNMVQVVVDLWKE
jgi:hypothetical protein